jgi:cellulose synthase (UDP-forming)
MEPPHEALDERPDEALSAAPSRVSTKVGARLGWWRTMLGAATALLGVRYMAWQISIGSPTPLTVVFLVAEALALTMFVSTFISLLDRGTRLSPGPAGGTLDVFIPVCGEPPAIVERTIRAALAVEYPHRTIVLNDGRMAGAPDWEEIDRLGERLGVTVLTRTAGQRGKAANLNHGLATSSADFVATIDADHRTHADLGDRMLGHFADPGVGYVQAAQEFERTPEVLNNRQDFFYRWLQPAKDASGAAISCGSGVVYRRAALDDVGGFSEWNIVEDLHTSYMLCAAGWRSVYLPEPVTIGMAPRTIGEYAHQRARWALDSLRILLFDNPLLKRGLRFKARLHFLQTTVTYLLAIPMLLFLVAPSLYLLFRASVAGGSSAMDYATHAIPYLGALVAFFVSLVGARNALALLRTTLFDSGITNITILRAVLGARPSGVSRKVAERRFSLLLFPQIVAAGALVVSLAVALVDDRPAPSFVAVVWAGINAFLLVPPLMAVSERQDRVRVASVAASVLVVGLFVVANVTTWATTRVQDAPQADPLVASEDQFVVHADDLSSVSAVDATSARDATTGSESATGAVAAQPSRLAVPSRGAYWGISSEEVQRSRDGVGGWQRSHDGATPQIVQWFQQWGSGENRFREDWVRNVAAAGAIPMITWEPWAKPDGLYADPTQDSFGLDKIAAGRFDTYIRSWAHAAAAYGGPLVLRLMHEFDGYWYPWSVGQNGQTAAQYVAAWRHVHAIFVEEGAVNVSWVWSMFGRNQDPAAAYPGDDVVDWVGGTVLNTGRAESGGWTDYRDLAGSLVRELAGYGKPVMLAEVGTNRSGGDSSRWIADAFSAIRTDQSFVRAIVLLDMPYDEQTDYRFDDATSRQLAVETADPGFRARLDVEPAY